MEELKRCSRCGRELPRTDFHKSASKKDGLQSECKECRCQIDKDSRVKRKLKNQGVAVTTINEKMHKVYAHSDLARFTPRQLMEELKARGYRWDYMLEPQKKIYYDKV